MPAVGGIRSRAQHFYRQRTGGVVDRGKRACAGDAAGNDRYLMLADRLGQAFDEIAAMAEIG